jgi:hypothetical protein
MDNNIELIHTALLNVIELLQTVALHHHKPSLLNDLATIKETISLLPKRIEEKELPEPYVRTILDNARLDCVIAHSTIKISLCYLNIQSVVSSSGQLKSFASEINHSLEVFDIAESHPAILTKSLKDELAKDMDIIRTTGELLNDIESSLHAEVPFIQHADKPASHHLRAKVSARRRG